MAWNYEDHLMAMGCTTSKHKQKPNISQDVLVKPNAAAGMVTKAELKEAVLNAN